MLVDSNSIISADGQHVVLFDLRHDRDNQYKEDALACCVSGYTSHIHALEEEVEDGLATDVQTTPCKITGLTENAAIVRIGDIKKILFCGDTLLAKLEDVVPVSGTANYQGKQLIAFTADQ